MKIIKLNILILIFAFITSCDCFRQVQGIVIDSETHLPIDSVIVTDVEIADSLRSLDSVIYTDSLGSFNYTSMSAGLFGCPKVLLVFEKKGYEKIIRKYKSCCTNNTTVILKNISD